MTTIIDTFREAHPLEILLFFGAAVNVLFWLVLLALKVDDIRRNRSNGPIRFMLNDNRRSGIWFSGFSLLLLYLSVSALRHPPDKHDYAWLRQTEEFMTGMCGATIFMLGEAIYLLRRRRKMAQLVAEYDSEQARMNPMEGGSRSYDPPNSGPVPRQD